MPTMKQKADRINAARLAQISAVNTKDPNANLPTTTGIEDIAPAILAIPTGGGESYDNFIQRGNFPGLFKNQDLNDDANYEGLKLFCSSGNWNIGAGDMSHIFDGASISQIVSGKDPMAYMYFPISSSVSDLSYAYYNLTLPNDYLFDKELDLTGYLVDGTMASLFENVRSSDTGLSPTVPVLRILLSSFGMAYATDISKAFYNTGAGIILVFDDYTDIDLSSITRADYAFAYMGGGVYNSSFEDAEGNAVHELTFTLPTSGTYRLDRFLKYNQSVQRVHFNTTSGCTNFTEMIHNCQNLLSIDGLDFSGITSTTNAPAGTTNPLTQIGKFGIVQGSNLGTLANARLDLSYVWNQSESTVRDGQTIGYWYEQFANALGNAGGTGQSIKLRSTLLNSLSNAQKELITNKGYTLAS